MDWGRDALRQVMGIANSWDPPEVGRWITWNSVGDKVELMGEVVWKYKDGDEIKVKVRCAHGGELTISRLSSLAAGGWKYIKEPSDVELNEAIYKTRAGVFNSQMGGLSCATCSYRSKLLQCCQGCRKVYYCASTCQLAAWPEHRKVCRRTVAVLRPHPRYPLPRIKKEHCEGAERSIAASQLIIQEEASRILQAALAGKDLTKSSPTWAALKEFNAGKQLTFEERYSIRAICGDPQDCCLTANLLKQGPTEIQNTYNGASDAFYRNFEKQLKNDELGYCGLHYMASTSGAHPAHRQTFLTLLQNLKQHGTVAPYHSPCQCNPQGQIPPRWRKLRKSWDRMLARARADRHDVQCMFTEARQGPEFVGCHNYPKCPFKHQIEVIKRRRTERQA